LCRENIAYVNLADVIHVFADKVLFLIAILGDGSLTDADVFLNNADCDVEGVRSDSNLSLGRMWWLLNPELELRRDIKSMTMFVFPLLSAYLVGIG